MEFVFNHLRNTRFTVAVRGRKNWGRGGGQEEEEALPGYFNGGTPVTPHQNWPKISPKANYIFCAEKFLGYVYLVN